VEPSGFLGSGRRSGIPDCYYESDAGDEFPIVVVRHIFDFIESATS
jgi:hypothetical protein